MASLGRALGIKRAMTEERKGSWLSKTEEVVGRQENLKRELKQEKATQIGQAWQRHSSAP